MSELRTRRLASCAIHPPPSFVVGNLLLCWSPYPRTLCLERPPGIDCFARSFPFAGTSGEPGPHTCARLPFPRVLSAIPGLSPPFHLAQHKNRPPLSSEIAGCATGSTRPLSAHLMPDECLSLYHIKSRSSFS